MGGTHLQILRRNSQYSSSNPSSTSRGSYIFVQSNLSLIKGKHNNRLCKNTGIDPDKCKVIQPAKHRFGLMYCRRDLSSSMRRSIGHQCNNHRPQDLHIGVLQNLSIDRTLKDNC